ncbi:MAG: 6-bladed beta-propeller [Tannerella sp.]|nr:6-bladed beta-propeller [Tannerella sp.]
MKRQTMMNSIEIICYVLVILLVIQCKSNDQEEGTLSYVDISKKYEEKEISLTDIAEVTYLHLKTDNEDYLYKGNLRYISEKTIIIPDDISGTILFFSKNGNPKSYFNRYGEGPEEYPVKGRDITSLIYDDKQDEVYLSFFNIIIVYSSEGKYKRKIRLPQGTRASIVDFDDRSLFVYNEQNQFNRFLQNTDFLSQSKDSSYFRISKTDGIVLDYVISPINEIDLTDCDGWRVLHDLGRLKRCAAGVILCMSETDTVFLYTIDKSLIPVFYKKPSVNNRYPKIVLSHFMDVGKYQFMIVKTLNNIIDINKYPNNYYVFDKQLGKLFSQKLILSDYLGKDFFISAQNTIFNGEKTYTHFELDIIELKQAHRENKLNGKLKALVASLNEDEDNNVFMLVEFK